MRNPDNYSVNNPSNINDKITKLAKRIRARHWLTAVGIAVLHSQNAVDLAVQGFRKRRGSIPVSIHDRWHIGSVTKSLTATLTGILVENKKLSFNTVLPELLPELNMHKSWHTCTLHNLLTHTSGLPANFPAEVFHIRPSDPNELHEIRKTLVEDALAAPATSTPGPTFQYSNLGYTVVALIAEIATAKNYQTLITEHIFSKLGLEDVGFGPPNGDKPEDQPMGHRVRFGFRTPIEPSKKYADNSPIMSPAGGLHMSLFDLVTYGKEHLEEGRNDTSLLKAETWKLLHRPVLNNYGCGWINQKKRWANGSILWHNGSNTLWYTLLLLIPQKKSVMAFVTNDGAVRKAERAFFKAAEEIANEL